jgi:chromosome segregation ATPase
LREDRERLQKLVADSGRKLRDSNADAARIKDLETQATASQAALTAAKAEATQAVARVTELQTALAAKPAAPAYPDVRNQVTDLKGQLSALSAEAEHSRQQLIAANKSRDDALTQVSSLQAQVAEAAKPRAPAYPDLSGRVAQLERELAAANNRPAAPSYPDLSGRVAELESRLTRQAADLTAVTAAKAEADKQVAALTKAASQARTEPITAASPTYPNLSLRVREL